MQGNPAAPESNDATAPITPKRKTDIIKRKVNHHTPDPLSERWFDKQEVLELMHSSESTLQKWRKKGLLPFSHILGKIYYKESDVLQMLDTCKNAGKG